MYFVILFLPIISYILFIIYIRLGPNYKSTSAPVVSGSYIPFLGDLNLMKPGFREYIDTLRQKHGDVYTVYTTGSYWTFIFGNENWKKLLTGKENVISSFEFLQTFLKPMQPMDMSMMIKVNESIDFFKISHDILNKKEHLSRIVSNVRTVMNEVVLDTKQDIDLFEYCYRMIFFFNMKSFAGDEIYDHHRNEFYELFKKLDYSKLNVPLEVLNKTFGIETASQAAYKRMEEIWKPIIEKRLKDRKSFSESEFDILDRVVDLVIQKVQIEKLKVEEYRVVTMVMFNFFIAAQITTSATCGWMFYSILSNPNVLDKVEKLAQQGNKDNLPLKFFEEESSFLEDVIVESVRFGLLGIGGRILKEDVEFDGKVVPKGNIVIHPYFGLASHFTDSKTFDPSRYTTRTEHNNDDSFSHSFTPFGKGRHPCAGKFVAVFGLKACKHNNTQPSLDRVLSQI